MILRAALLSLALALPAFAQGDAAAQARTAVALLEEEYPEAG